MVLDVSFKGDKGGILDKFVGMEEKDKLEMAKSASGSGVGGGGGNSCRLCRTILEG